MSTNWTAIRKEIETRFTNGYVVAVSGGIDSMFLLDFMHRSDVKMIVCYFNHGNLDTDDRDETFVVDYCSKLGVECVVGRGDGEKILAASSVESECRDQRYAFMTKLVVDRGFDRIITGHHLDDNLETVLLRLLRGHDFDNLHMKIDNGVVYRPLLHVKKQELIKHCIRRNIPWLEDRTNTDTTLERNWIRHDVIPMLCKRRNIDGIAKSIQRMHDREIVVG